MRRVISVSQRGDWPGGRFVAAVTLPFEARHKRRLKMTDDQGLSFLLDLEKATQLNDGDGLVLEDGGVIRVHAAPEAIADINCATPIELARLAWHIGNRHTPIEVLDEGTLRIRDDHVMIDMLRGLGASITRHTAPFAPESGAYSKSSGGGHGNSHSHGH